MNTSCLCLAPDAQIGLRLPDVLSVRVSLGEINILVDSGEPKVSKDILTKRDKVTPRFDFVFYLTFFIIVLVPSVLQLQLAELFRQKLLEPPTYVCFLLSVHMARQECVFCCFVILPALCSTLTRPN